jgi:hypothetical protein
MFTPAELATALPPATSAATSIRSATALRPRRLAQLPFVRCSIFVSSLRPAGRSRNTVTCASASRVTPANTSHPSRVPSAGREIPNTRRAPWARRARPSSRWFLMSLLALCRKRSQPTPGDPAHVLAGTGAVSSMSGRRSSSERVAEKCGGGSQQDDSRMNVRCQQRYELCQVAGGPAPGWRVGRGGRD